MKKIIIATIAAIFIIIIIAIIKKHAVDYSSNYTRVDAYVASMKSNNVAPIPATNTKSLSLESNGYDWISDSFVGHMEVCAQLSMRSPQKPNWWYQALDAFYGKGGSSLEVKIKDVATTLIALGIGMPKDDY